MRIFPVLSWLAVGILILATASWAAESDVDRLLDLLVEKGVVTKDDAAGFRQILQVPRLNYLMQQSDISLIHI